MQSFQRICAPRIVYYKYTSIPAAHFESHLHTNATRFIQPQALSTAVYTMSHPSSRQLVSTPSSVQTGMPYVEFCSELNTLFVGAMTGHMIGPDGEVLTRPDSSAVLRRPNENRIALGMASSLKSFQTGEDLSTVVRDNRDKILQSVARATAQTFAHGTDVMTDRDLADEFNVKGVRLILTTAEQPATQSGGAGKYEPAWTDMPIVTFDWEADTKDTSPKTPRHQDQCQCHRSEVECFSIRSLHPQRRGGTRLRRCNEQNTPRLSWTTNICADRR